MSQVYDDFYDKMVDLGRCTCKEKRQKSLENECFCPDLGPFQILFGKKKTRKISEVDLGILLADFDNIM